ncbi:WD40/YVTN/BNR-like repeat-containing protein [Micavibrio aeruginosavorus]|uniref:Conserved domain protein n=1 Tax=Micavibrio aeruginosavorus (strain ARL-13) TaxID=856793 RepID=G2KMH2_MICAA|nr:hypothetical protein [Micavibrio aeruginosavorus]AEP10665.1 conserved domain protein [Micavibrio aeruginosavorus ARL-13]
MKKTILSVAIMLCVLSSAKPSWAAGEQPGDACTVAGAVVRAAGPDQVPYLTLVCNGSTWVLADERTTAGRSLFRVGSDATACDATKVGRISFVGGAWTYCHDSSWKAIGLPNCAAGQGLTQGVAGPECCPTMGWAVTAPPEANSWSNVTYGNGLFVAVSTNGTNRIMTSPDGVNWTARAAPENLAWNRIFFGNNLFIVTTSSTSNRIMTSPDGVTWTARTVPQSNSWQGVTYGNGLYVAVSSNGTNRVMTSPDGVTWTLRTAAADNAWMAITYGDGLFVATSSNGTNRVMTSPNGITWTSRFLPGTDPAVYSIAYGNGRFAGVSSGGRVFTSTDGINWSQATLSETNFLRSITFNGTKFITVSNNGTSRIATSVDGVTWQLYQAPEASNWMSVTNGGGKVVATATSGTNTIMYSIDVPCP